MDSAMYFVVAYVYSGLAPVRARPWYTNKIPANAVFTGKIESA